MIKRGISRGKAQMLTIRMEAGCKHLEQLFSCLWILVAFTRLLVLPGVSSALGQLVSYSFLGWAAAMWGVSLSKVLNDFPF